MTAAPRRPRLAIVSRIYAPEPAAASFALESCARAFRDAGWDVRVLTSRYLEAPARENQDGVEVRRARVLRDAAGYVKGYTSYLSFDVPLAFRMLFMPRVDVILVEPPPTTGAVVRVVAAVRRIPYVYDAADIWSDAAVNVTSSRLVVRLLRAIERFALRGARRAFVVAPAYGERIRALGIDTPISVTGFGVDTTAFDFREEPPPASPFFVYGGSYSEWHGAGIFVEALALLRARCPDARVLYVGNGAERPALERRAAELGLADAIEFRDPIPAAELAVILSSATASLASLKPGAGYDYAFVTKVYSSLATGCPVVFTGAGPAGPFLREAAGEVAAGEVVGYDAAAVADAMHELACRPVPPSERARLSTWTRRNHSLSAVAGRIVAATVTDVTHP